MMMGVDHLHPGSARCVGRTRHERTLDRQSDRSGHVHIGAAVRAPSQRSGGGVGGDPAPSTRISPRSRRPSRTAMRQIGSFSLSRSCTAASDASHVAGAVRPSTTPQISTRARTIARDTTAHGRSPAPWLTRSPGRSVARIASATSRDISRSTIFTPRSRATSDRIRGGRRRSHLKPKQPYANLVPRTPRTDRSAAGLVARSELVIYDGRREVARHDRVIGLYQQRLDLDHYLRRRAVVALDPVDGRRHAGAPSGGCSSTRGLYSTSWMRPSKVRCSIISRATSG
jgi:hypothetical protein